MQETNVAENASYSIENRSWRGKKWTHPPVYPLQQRHLKCSSHRSPTEKHRMSGTMEGFALAAFTWRSAFAQAQLLGITPEWDRPRSRPPSLPRALTTPVRRIPLKLSFVCFHLQSSSHFKCRQPLKYPTIKYNEMYFTIVTIKWKAGRHAGTTAVLYLSVLLCTGKNT